jgi:hypothetical protein
MAQRKVKAAYHVRDVGEQEVTSTVYTIQPAVKDEDGNVLQPSMLVPSEQTKTERCFMVMFPQGHSIRAVAGNEAQPCSADDQAPLDRHGHW